MDEVGGCHDTLKASEGEIKKMKHGSTQAFDPWNKKETRNAFHRKRNRDISTFCYVIFRRIPPIKKYSLLRADNTVASLVCKSCIDYSISIQQDATLHSLFYLETALHVSGGTSTHHQDREQPYLQHLVCVTPLLLPAAIVEELEPV